MQHPNYGLGFVVHWPGVLLTALASYRDLGLGLCHFVAVAGAFALLERQQENMGPGANPG